MQLRQTRFLTILAAWLAVALASFSISDGSFAQDRQAIKSSIDQGERYLYSQVQDDGLWHSEYYGNLKGGAAVSALAIYASSLDPKLSKSEESVLQKAIDILATHVEKHGYVANTDGPDYSNYASAYLLLAAKQSRLQLKWKTRHKLISYLVGAQLDSGEGYKKGDDDFGGWDLSGWMKGKRRTTGTNISVSATVLEALLFEHQALELRKKQSKPEIEDKELRESFELAFSRARVWIQNCQNEDGGFHFHPEKKHQGNKAGWPNRQLEQPKSYGSATADGIRCLLVLEQVTSGTESRNSISKRLKKACDWLDRQGKPNRVPGFDDADNRDSWAHGLKYYYWMSLAESAEIRREKKALNREQESKLLAFVIESQDPKGFWSNTNARMREDDPLIATSFALITLRNAEHYRDLKPDAE